MDEQEPYRTWWTDGQTCLSIRRHDNPEWVDFFNINPYKFLESLLKGVVIFHWLQKYKKLPILTFSKRFFHFWMHMSSKWIFFGVIGRGMKFLTSYGEKYGNENIKKLHLKIAIENLVQPLSGIKCISLAKILCSSSKHKRCWIQQFSLFPFKVGESKKIKTFNNDWI